MLHILHQMKQFEQARTVFFIKDHHGWRPLAKRALPKSPKEGLLFSPSPSILWALTRSKPHSNKAPPSPSCLAHGGPEGKHGPEDPIPDSQWYSSGACIHRRPETTGIVPDSAVSHPGTHGPLIADLFASPKCHAICSGHLSREAGLSPTVGSNHPWLVKPVS